MNNKMSVHILVALLFVAFSCKSEVKSTQPILDNSPVKETKSEAQEDEVAKEVISIETGKEEKEVEKEVVKKEIEKASKKDVKTTSTTTPANNVVDKGIEIEMGGSDSNEKSEKVDPIEEVKEEEKVEEKETEVVTEKPSKPERIETIIGFPSHIILDGLLKTHVSSFGKVDYEGLKNNEAKLDEYLSNLESNAPGTTWNRNQKLAYWINAYNAYTIKLILKNYPVASITDLHGGKPWDVKWIKLDGKTLSLNNIENDIIRPKYNEPRIHFAVNCAAKSCPPILNAAYKAKSLDAQLESQTKKFVNNPSFNTLGKNEIMVSKIFDWYGVDFGDVASFILRYADTTVKPSAKVSFMEYDWKLNGK